MIYEFDEISILVVDDNPIMRRLIREILYTFRTKKIEDGSDVPSALTMLKSFPADLIITDWNMTPMDGIDFARLIRTSKDSQDPYVPIIMLTGYTEMERVVQARDAGVNEFLAKPISATSLYWRIISIIENPRTFIRGKTYTGPEGRRRDLGPPDGIPNRRGGVRFDGRAMPVPEKIRMSH